MQYAAGIKCSVLQYISVLKLFGKMFFYIQITPYEAEASLLQHHELVNPPVECWEIVTWWKHSLVSDLKRVVVRGIKLD